MQYMKVLSDFSGAAAIAVPVRPERIDKLTNEGYRAVRKLQEAYRLGASACIVATDTCRHASDGACALDSGMDLLVEKPLAAAVKDAWTLSQKAKDRGSSLFVSTILRFSRALEEFCKKVMLLGPLHHVRIECASYLPDWRPGRDYRETYSARSEEGGVLRDLIHEIDYACWLFGWPESVQAVVNNSGRLGIDSEEAADLTWKNADCTVSIHLDYLTKPARRRLAAYGDAGTLHCDLVSGVVSLDWPNRPAEMMELPDSRSSLIASQVRAFMSQSTNDCDPRLADGIQGLKALSICEAAQRASESRREEPVLYP